MSRSTDAILVYGYDLGASEELAEEVQERLAYLMDEGSAELSAMEERTGCAFVSHCSSEYENFIIGVQLTEIRASRGYPEHVPVESLMAAPVGEFQKWLDEFAELGKLPKGLGRWLLASWWG